MANSGVLQEWFDRVDSAKTGSITAIQLQRALAVGNLQFPITIVQQMVRMYDFDRNGTMSFEEFVALNKFLLKVQQAFSDLERGRGFLVPDEVYENREAVLIIVECGPLFSQLVLLNKLTRERFTMCIRCPFSLQAIYATFRFGSLYGMALLKIDISLDSPAFYTVCESFDKQKDGRFRLDDLISLCIFVQSARNLFNSFDTSKQGRVTLDLNQFIYCTANCRI